MSDQADQLRNMVRQTIESRPKLAPGLPLVTVSGGAPQVGATTVAIELAQELSNLGKRVLVVDANLQNPGLRESLQLRPGPGLTDVLAGNVTLRESIRATNAHLHVVPGTRAESTDIQIKHDDLLKLVAELRGVHSLVDLVLVDVGHGMTPWTHAWWQASRQVLVVATTDEDAIKGAYANVKLSGWCEGTAELHLVVNKCTNEMSGMRISERFATTSQRFLGVPIAEASPIPERDAAAKQFKRAVRLLAGDMIAHSSESSTTLQREQRPSQELLAWSEESLHSRKQIQQSA